MGIASLHHIALTVTDFDWCTAFFEEVFQFTVRRTKNAAPKRQLWYHEGIQLVENLTPATNGNAVDHVAIGVEDIPGTVAQALSRGCKPYEKGAHWFILPNGVKIELMEN